jgi:hypothetical protein
MRIFGIVGLLLILPLLGCKAQDDLPPGYWFPTPFTPTKQELAARKAEWAVKDDETCKGYGAKPGSDIYIQCRMSLQQTRDAGDNAIAAAASAPTVANNQPVPNAGSPPVLRNILPQQTRCQTVGVGRTMQTVCQ